MIIVLVNDDSTKNVKLLVRRLAYPLYSPSYFWRIISESANATVTCNWFELWQLVWCSIFFRFAYLYNDIHFILKNCTWMWQFNKTFQVGLLCVGNIWNLLRIRIKFLLKSTSFQSYTDVTRDEIVVNTLIWGIIFYILYPKECDRTESSSISLSFEFSFPVWFSFSEDTIEFFCVVVIGQKIFLSFSNCVSLQYIVQTNFTLKTKQNVFEYQLTNTSSHFVLKSECNKLMTKTKKICCTIMKLQEKSFGWSTDDDR